MAERPASLVTFQLALAFFANLAHSSAFFAYMHLPGHLERLGAHETRIGIVTATMALSAIGARPWVGRMMDTRGRKPVALIGGVLNVLACLGYLLVDDLGPVLYAVRLVHGIADAMLFSVLFTIAADIVPRERRAEGIALFGISGLLPVAFGGALGDLVLRGGDYRGLFVATAACSTLGTLACVPMRDSRPVTEVPSRALAATVGQRDLLPLWWMGFAFAFGFAAHFTFAKTYVLSLGGGSLSGFYGAYGCAAVGLRLVLGRMPDRLGALRVLHPAMFSLVLGLVLLSSGGDPLRLVLAGALCGTSHAFAFPILSAMVVDRVAPADRGTSMALFTALFDVGLVVGGPVLGLVAEQLGYRAMFVLAAVWVIAAMATFAGWEARTRR